MCVKLTEFVSCSLTHFGAVRSSSKPCSFSFRLDVFVRHTLFLLLPSQRFPSTVPSTHRHRWWRSSSPTLCSGTRLACHFLYCHLLILAFLFCNHQAAPFFFDASSMHFSHSFPTFTSSSTQCLTLFDDDVFLQNSLRAREFYTTLAVYVSLLWRWVSSLCIMKVFEPL